MIKLLKEVDFRQTKASARDVLKNFRCLERIAGRPLIDLKSPIITNMPRTQSHRNKAGDVLVQLVGVEVEGDTILFVLMASSLISCQVLYCSFCDAEKHTNWEIGQLIRGYGEKNVEKLKSNALIEFAEACKHGTLVVYKQKILQGFCREFVGILPGNPCYYSNAER